MAAEIDNLSHTKRDMYFVVEEFSEVSFTNTWITYSKDSGSAVSHNKLLRLVKDDIITKVLFVSQGKGIIYK